MDDAIKSVEQSRHYRSSLWASGIFIATYFVSREFYGRMGMLLFMPYLCSMIAVFVAFIRSIFSFFLNRKIYKSVSFPLTLNTIMVIVICCLPSVFTGKNYFKQSVVVNQIPGNETCPVNLYIDYYLAQSNFLATDTNAGYFTDHHNFRLYLGTLSEDDEVFSVRCHGDYIIVTKRSFNGEKALDTQTFSLTTLKERHVFE